MPDESKRSHGRHGLLWTVALIVLFSVPVLQRSDTREPLGSSKLTTVLADIARSIPQDLGPTPLTGARQDQKLNPAALPKSASDATRGRLLRFNSKGEPQVYILMNAVTDDNLHQLETNGVTVEIPAPAQRRVQARIPINRLQAVSALPFVNFIRLPSYAVQMTGSVDTEGDLIHKVQQARQQFSVDGSGVKVGVISDGIKGIFEPCPSPGSPCSVFGLPNGPISTGDLPPSTGARNSGGVLTSTTGGITGMTFTGDNDLEGIVPACGFAGAGAEGTALLEIVHDIAPGAQLSFANADTDIAFNQAVSTLAASNDVVMDDLGFYGLPADGTSDVSSNTASALNSSTNPIRTYVTSAGNAATGHYYGTFADSGVNGLTIPGISNSGNLHLFQQTSDTTDVLGLGPKPYNVIKLPTNGEVYVILAWDDPFGASGNNYDVYLVKESTGAVVDRSTDSQTGSQDPMEIIDYTNPGAEDNFHIVIQNVGNRAAAKHLNLYSFEPECGSAGPELLAAPRHEKQNYNTATKSVPAQSDAGGSPVSAISVGAICSASAKAQAFFNGSAAPDESCLDATNSTIEYFSSLGPTLDGRNKPDIAGIDGVSITGAGNFENPFFGTSAAAPHIAGIAALLLQSKECLLTGVPGALDNVTARTDLRNLILDNAVPSPSGGAVPNNTFGAGLADALASTQATIPVFSGPTTLYVPANSTVGASLNGITPQQVGFPEPEACPMAEVIWAGDCGPGPSSVINCGFGTHNVTVAASNNNGLTFSQAVALQIVVTNFSVNVAPPASETVRAGLSASYSIFASAQGGAFNNPVKFTCSNLPAGSSCAFNPPTITPGATSATTSMAIATTGSALAPPVFGGPPDHFNERKVLPMTLLLAIAVFTAIYVAGLRKAPFMSLRRLASAGLLSLALAFPSIQMGCGSRSPIPSPPPVPTPPGSYQVTITGTSGSLTQTNTVTLVVQ